MYNYSIFHTAKCGVVRKIQDFKTIEGNVSNQHKVDTRDYTADSSTLSGFIKLDKYIT